MTVDQQAATGSQPANYPTCSVIVPTLGDRESLQTVIDCLSHQTVPINTIIISVGSDVPRPPWFEPDDAAHLWTRAAQRGAATQRNHAVTLVAADIIAFLDDDVSFADDLFEKVLRVFAGDVDKRIGAASPRMAGSGHPRPSAALRAYYRWQAGYKDETYGARLFGYGLSTYPCYGVQTEAMIPADWLNSPCLFVRREDFLAARFPDFHGYSFGEDAYLTAMIKKSGKQLFFLNEVEFQHHAGIGDYKSDHFRLARMKTRNQGRIAREVLSLKGWRYWSKKIAHQCFVSACLARDRKKGWLREIAGVWSA
jgi:glycosyltransferase involved in cell wall biosynthesis